MAKRSIVLLIPMMVMLYGCGGAHVRTEVATQDWAEYESVYLQRVQVYSKEPSAKDNEALHQKMREWHAYTVEQIQGYLTQTPLEVLEQEPTSAGRTLAVKFDVEVQYGNRALRYFIGFGAGKGGVYSTLTLTDADSGEIKYKAHSNSELQFGVVGGDVGQIFESNINELISRFDSKSKLTR